MRLKKGNLKIIPTPILNYDEPSAVESLLGSRLGGG